jgi:hypothetical protein
MKRSRRPLSLHPLAACLALAFAAPAADAKPQQPATVVVQNCLDHGAGSLRQAIIDNTGGGPIDLTALSCSSITLTTGRLEVTRAQLIQGPGSGAFEINGAGLDRVFSQLSTQTLALYGMTIRNGYADSFGGGCVYSSGNLQLNDTVVSDCRASDIASTVPVKGGGVMVKGTFVAIHSAIVHNDSYSALGTSYGGGAFVEGSAVFDHSTISGNTVSSGSNTVAFGGGAEVDGALTMMYSTVSNNGAFGSAGGTGGLRAMGGASIVQSTISGNQATTGVGGLYLFEPPSTPNAIIDSTISGNTAAAIAGVRALGATSIQNSTIAFNTETGATPTGAGLYMSFGAANLQSTIIASNRSAGGAVQNVGLNNTGSLIGANNLIGSSPQVTLPPGTIGGDPKLLPLHFNGGSTKTHSLANGSPALNTGATSGAVTTDQRGTGFPRTVGAATDIGAYEGVDTDLIFANEFD